MRQLIPILFIFSFFTTTAFPCSTFSFTRSNEVIAAKNFDWDFGHGMVIANQRGLSKTALSNGTPVEWISKFGSVTLNQVSRELPQGGINEKGLMVEMLWLSTAQFPAPSSHPAINESQWIQYQLDNFSSVDEVVKNLTKLDIIAKMSTIHYFVCDTTGACAAIEGIDGKFVVHEKNNLPIMALTNDTYDNSLAFSNNSQNTLPNDGSSLARFTRLAHNLKNQSFSELTLINTAFANLDSVSSARTQWRIVYNLTNKTLTFKTLLNSNEKSINLSEIDFTCRKLPQGFDMNRNDVKFVNYTTAMNTEIAYKSLVTGFAHMPTVVADKVANYPESLKCLE